MATAVVRVIVDADGNLSAAEFDDGLAGLRDQGLEVLSVPTDRLPERRREVELIVETPLQTGEYLELCAKAFRLGTQLGVITYISRGTDEDAVGVLSRFGLAGVVQGSDEDEDLVIVTLPAARRREVPESRLLTALEAALNCEVSLRFG